MCPVNQGLRPAHDSRVIQIPHEWPERYGTVLEVKDGTASAGVLIGWDDGRRDWIESEDFRQLRI